MLDHVVLVDCRTRLEVAEEGAFQCEIPRFSEVEKDNWFLDDDAKAEIDKNRPERYFMVQENLSPY